MSKKEAVDAIIYDMKLKGTADFEVDGEESFSVASLKNGGYVLESQHRYMEVKNLTEARKTISKLGSDLLCL